MAPVPEGGFRWEVAFSLLDGDLDVAKAIVALLEDRLSSFLYSEAQLEIAATDGLETFTTVFRRDARVVVVLSRKNWGQTKWTRIEQTAITNRGFDEGWDFLIVDEEGLVTRDEVAASCCVDLAVSSASDLKSVRGTRLGQLAAIFPVTSLFGSTGCDWSHGMSHFA